MTIRATLRLAACAALTLTVSACGAAGGDRRDAAPEAPAATTVAQSPAPATAAALARVPDGPAARRRLAYADRDRLRAAGLPAARIARRVLGADAAAGTTVATGEGRRPFTPGAAPETAAIAPPAVSAVQSCLGDAAAQTILGPGAMGEDAAVGAGVAATPDGDELRLCFAPRLLRDLHRSERQLRKRLAGVTGARVAEVEIGEREIVTGTAPARRVGTAPTVALVGGGAALRRLAPWD